MRLKQIMINGKAHQISDSNIPELYIWDIATIPNNLNEIVVIMAGWGSQKEPTSNIWHGTLSEDNNKPFTWVPINGTGIGSLPVTPINALVIDENEPSHTMYVGTDIGVFKSSNKGESWIRFSENLPVCAVYDMRFILKQENCGLQHMEEEYGKEILILTRIMM